MMNLSQTKLAGLTMELDLKTREYKKLCDKLEKLKQGNINPNDEKLLELKKLFQKNHDEIVEINKQLRRLKEDEEKKEQEIKEKINSNNIFKDKRTAKKNENMNLIIKEDKKEIFIIKILKFIRNIFKKSN